MEYFEEDKHLSETLCCKAIKDMDFMKVEIGSLLVKFDMLENHALGKIQNFVSEK